MTYLPSPPTPAERTAYFGAQRRWVFVVLFVSFCGVIFGMARMAMHAAWTAPLLAAGAVLFVYALVSVLSSTRRRRHSLADHDRLVGDWYPGSDDTLDVFLPSVNEPESILENTYRYVSRLNWPRHLLNVYVLDDCTEPSAFKQRAAHRYGFRYIARPTAGVMKKAGNLKYAYEHSAGKLILILDADWAAHPDMALEIAPYFQDPTLGIVQTPQYFDIHPPAPHTARGHHRRRRRGRGRFNWLQRSSAAVQELFYRWIQPSRDAVDGAICVGTNAMYRRAALARSGGFAQIGHSEDVHTGVNMIKVGYKTRYVPIVVAKGVCPDTFDGHANMVYRWCTGSMSLLGDADFHRARLGRRQRWCFWTGFLYYITSGVLAIVGPLPGLLMVWAFPQDVEPVNFLPLVPSTLTAFLFLPAMTAGWRPEIIRLTYLNSYCHLFSLYDTLRERVSAWVPTGAARNTPLAKRVNRAMRTWGLGVQVAMWVGIGRGVLNYGISHFWMTAGYSALVGVLLFPLFMPGKGLGRQTEPAPAHVPDETLVLPRLPERTAVIGA